MEVTLNRKGLKEAITALKPCLPAKPLTDYESNMAIRVSPGTASLVATDMVQEGVMPLAVVSQSGGSVDIVPDIKKLEKVITKSETEAVVLSYEEGSGALRVSSGSGFVDVPTLPALKMGKYDFPAAAGDVVGQLPATVLGDALSFIECFLPDTITGQLKFEVATLASGMLTAANGWNRRGYFISQSLKLKQEIKFLQRFVATLPKLLRHVTGDLSVELHERSIVMRADSGFRYSCVRARHETPEPVLAYLKSAGPYLTLDTVKLTKVLDKVVVPDYQAAGAPVGVELVIPPAAEGSIDSELLLKLVSSGAMQAQDKFPCKRVSEDKDPRGELVEKVVDYRMFKSMVSELRAGAENRVYMSDPASRFFKFQSKFAIDGHSCLAISVGSYSKKVGNASR
jgi:hypothetical protein